jgi:hypothetical protein
LTPSCGYFDPLDPGREPPQPVTWERIFGGPGEDATVSVQQTADGGFVLAGYTEVEGTLDGWLLKSDNAGNWEWSRSYGGPGEDRGLCVQQTADMGYIVVGGTFSFGAGGQDVWLIKTDSKGALEWSRTYGGVGSEEGRSVRLTSDGGYVIAGVTDSFGAEFGDAYLIKTDADGNEEWSRTFGDTQTEGCSVRQTADGGYLVGGTCQEDAYILKTTPTGQEEWSRRFGNDFPDYGSCAVTTAGGGFGIAGSTRSGESGDFDAWLIRTDDSGTDVWRQSYGGSAWDRADCVFQTADGGYVLVGMMGSFRYAWLIKTDPSGATQWDARFGTEDRLQEGLCGQQAADGGYMICGWSDSQGAGGRDGYLIYYRPPKGWP